MTLSVEILLALLPTTLTLSSGGLRLTLHPVFKLQCDLDMSDPWNKVFLDNETDTKSTGNKQSLRNHSLKY